MPHQSVPLSSPGYPGVWSSTHYNDDHIQNLSRLCLLTWYRWYVCVYCPDTGEGSVCINLIQVMGLCVLTVFRWCVCVYWPNTGDLSVCIDLLQVMCLCVWTWYRSHDLVQVTGKKVLPGTDDVTVGTDLIQVKCL